MSKKSICVFERMNINIASLRFSSFQIKILQQDLDTRFSMNSSLSFCLKSIFFSYTNNLRVKFRSKTSAFSFSLLSALESLLVKSHLNGLFYFSRIFINA